MTECNNSRLKELDDADSAGCNSPPARTYQGAARLHLNSMMHWGSMYGGVFIACPG